MKISFDRKEYLSVSSVFENESLDDVNTELSEFNDDATDMAYELAYTRYALAKCEARNNALREAVAWERECRDANMGGVISYATHHLWLTHGDGYLDAIQEDYEDICHAARAEVDRLIANASAANCEGEG